MNSMRLYASMVVPIVRDFELFAVLEVVSDTARRHDPEYVRRDVIGTVRLRGPIWADYLNQWLGIASDPVVAQILPACKRPFAEGGRTFLCVSGLQVDYDFYGLHSWLNVEGDNVRLILMERHDGMIEEYQAKVAGRNQRIQARIDHAHSGNFTANDLRDVMGLPRDPQFEHRLPPDAVQAMLESPSWRETTRNTVV